MTKISIIVPVYNVEKFLRRCIESILNQTFKDFELILINDGSKDKSLDVMNEYKNDKRVKIFTQENKGPAITRNLGIKKSEGKYIMFIDSDDYILPNYVENYYNAMISGNYDLVIGGYQKITGDHIDFIRKLDDGEFSKYMVTGPVCKMYRRDFIIKNDIEFLDTTASEDVYFNVCAYSKNPKIKIIDDIGYFYYFNPNSISNTQHKGFNKNVDILQLVDTINYEFIENIALNQYFIIRYLIWYLLYSGKSAKGNDFMNEYKNYFCWIDKNIPTYRTNKYLKKFPKGENKKIYLFIRTFMLFHKCGLVKLFSKFYCKGD